MKLQLTLLLATGLILGTAATTQAQSRYGNDRDIRHDRQEVRHDRRDVRYDRGSMARDRFESSI